MSAARPLPLPDLGPLERVLRAFDEAPEGEPLTAEQEAECAARDADLRAGHVKAVRHEEIARKIEQMRAQQGA